MILILTAIMIGIVGTICLGVKIYSSYDEWRCHKAYVIDKYGILIPFRSFEQYYYLAPSCWAVDRNRLHHSLYEINADLKLNRDDYHYWLVYMNDGKRIRVGMETWKDYRELIKFLEHTVEEKNNNRFNCNQRANYEWFLYDMQQHIEKLKKQAEQERKRAESSTQEIIDRLKEEYNLG